MNTSTNQKACALSSQKNIFIVLTLGIVALGGCVADTEQDDSVGGEEETSSSSDEIIGGTNVSQQYPEAVTIDMSRTGTTAFCSGVLIAPMVVLTAGHCVDGFTSWTVKVGTESRTTTSKAIYDWTSGGSLNPLQHDVAVLFLNSPIWLRFYPTIAQTAVAANTPVTNVGRIHNGVTSEMWGAHVYDLNDGSIIGAPPPYSGSTFAFDYSATRVLEPGDSGGPVFLKDAEPHRIVAINSGGGTLGNGMSIELLARVDLVKSWITQQIAAHPAQAPTDAQVSCVFNWAEINYPNLFAPRAPGVLLDYPPYKYRPYPGTNSNLGAAWSNGNSPSVGAASPNVNYPVKHVYYMGPSGAIEDYGTVGYWMKQANCL
ncbi:MAG TPA: S1 family peptidase [Polyangium sp.]|nr:S1 family peptidase [Polyangium sp.]